MFLSKNENENRHHFWKKIRIYTSFQKNAKRIPKCFYQTILKKSFQKSKMKIADPFGKKLDFTPLSKKTHQKFLNVFIKRFSFLEKSFQKSKMKIATTFGKKLDFTPLSKKTHPKFLNVFIKRFFFLENSFQKSKMKIATTFGKKFNFTPLSKKTHPENS